MKKKVSIVSILMFCVSVVYAQDYTFKVLASKGVAQVDNGSSWVLLKSGSKLNKKNKIKVSQGSYVGLMHTSGKTLELKTPGTYEVENLSGKLNNSQSSFTSKYASFVLNQPSAEEAAQNYNVTGSVSRGSEIVVRAPKHIDMYKEIPALITWEDKLEDETYVVTITSLFNKNILEVETTDKYYELDLSELNLEDEAYLFKVQLKSDPSAYGERALKVIDNSKKEDKGAVVKELDELKKEIDPTSPLDQLTLASYFEEKGLTIYALSSLSRASNLAPEVEDFEILRNHYFYNNALKK